MSTNKKNYKNLDLVRLFSCIAVFLFHLNILKGGYLAVCSFFVLTGYLSCVSAFKKEKFSFKEYYLNKLFKIYVPLLIVVFISILVILLFPDILWLNLKPETTSVLLGYNNFWQLGANLDYFARHVNSPFMHFWYMGILLQFYLFFPFIYLAIRKIEEKQLNKVLSCVISILLSIIFAFLFYNIACGQNMMVTYYDTFARLFSILFGITLGFIHSYFKPWIPKLFEKNNIGFYFYLLVLVVLFLFVQPNSSYFKIGMILTSLITCRLISYSVLNTKRVNLFDKIVRSLSNVSYEIYLVQYPIIFLFGCLVNVDKNLATVLIIILTIIISYFIHFIIDFKNKKFMIIKYILASIILLLSIGGAYEYFIAEDHTKEMKQLENQLALNKQISLKKQKEYEKKLKQEQNDWQEVLNDLETDKKGIEEVVNSLPVIGIGDSVLLGAVSNLYQTFPNGYFDGNVSRTAYEAEELITSLKNKNVFGGPIIFNLGANGDCSMQCKEKVVELCDDREIFWLTVTNDKDVHFNYKLEELANKHSNFHIIDWESISKGHDNWFVADGIHLTDSGRKAYSKAIYDAIYKIYLDEYNLKKEETLKKHEDALKKKVSFYGDELLLNVYDYIQKDFIDSKFIIEKEYSFDDLKLKLEREKAENNLTYKLVFMLENVTEEEYRELAFLLKDYEVYLILTDKSISNIEGVTIVNFYDKIRTNKDYLMMDRVHLTDLGKLALSQMIKESLIEINN